MSNSTTDVYASKRETVNLLKILVIEKDRVESKFITQAIYGTLKSGSVILRNVAAALDEPIQIKNTIDPLSQKKVATYHQVF